MNHERAFLQAIREAPHDDAPRLIYADWLEEQGGAARTARAAFIRLQCRLAELPEDDPAQPALEDEAADILAEYEGTWTQPLHGIAEDWRFERGFVEHLRIRGDNLLTHAESLFDFAPLRSLHLLIHRNDVPHLAACPQLRWVAALDFSRCQFNDRSLQQLLLSPHLDRLRALNLSGNVINTPGVRALAQSPLFARLRLLDLSRNIGVGDNAVIVLSDTFEAENLEALSLAGTNTTVDSFCRLLASTRLRRLTDLNFSSVRATSAQLYYPPRTLMEDSKLLGQLRALDLSESSIPMILPGLVSLLVRPNLRRLSLRSIGADRAIAERLADAYDWANLTALDLGSNHLGAAGAQALTNSPRFASLRRLDVSYNNIRDTGAKALAASPHLTRLLELDVSGNGMGGPGLKALAESANLAHLRTLGLAGNFIGSESARALAESEHLRNLTWLDLSDAFLEEDSARALASSANLARLRTLLLKKNLLGDGGAKALAQSPHLARLTALDLNDNRIGKAGAEALAAAAWRRMHNLDVRGNVFTDTQEALLRQRFGNAVQL